MSTFILPEFHRTHRSVSAGRREHSEATVATRWAKQAGKGGTCGAMSVPTATLRWSITTIVTKE